mmetsp:Transcript_34793/g.68688  ORF Transcript_34793/g.68688 Transcript_34793/m.68688 type:complete len:773 (+) Transcript_34793:38-2356(+)
MEQTLKVTIVSARGLRDADRMPGAGKSDPYCTCEVLGKKVPKIQTKVVNNTCDPVWEHQAQIVGFSPGDVLVFKLYDKDIGKRDDFLGTAFMTTEQFYPTGFEGELPLSEAGPGINAFLRIRIHPVLLAANTNPAASSSGFVGFPTEPMASSNYKPSRSAKIDACEAGSGSELVKVETGHRATDRMNLSTLTQPSGTAFNETIPRPNMPHGTWVNAKQVQESAVVVAVRRALEGMEDKVMKHIAKEMTRVQVHGDRMREAAVSRVDAKLGTLEALQQKLDRRLAEIGGSTKGLSDEMQSQIRRIDQMDASLFAWRQQLEEELHVKFSGIEQQAVQLATSIRVSKSGNDDAFRRFISRVVKLEEMMEERSAHSVDLSHSVMNLHGRLLQCEEGEPKSREMQVSHGSDLGDQYVVELVEKQRADGLVQLSNLQHENNELRSRIEMQEESHKHLRTLWEAKEEQFKSLRNMFERDNWEGRLKGIQSRVQMLEAAGAGHTEHMSILNQKLDHQQHEQHSSLMGNLSSLFYNQPDVLKSGEAADIVQRELDFPRLSQEEARARADEARRFRNLPQLHEDHENELSTIINRGAVNVIHHDVHGMDNPAPTPGSRFIVVDEPSLMCHQGTLIEPTGEDDEWTVRLDNGTRTVLRSNHFHVAPSPVASLSLRTPLEFKGVQHFGSTEPIFEDEESAMRLLDDAAQVLKLYPNVTVSIEGHTATPENRMDIWAHELAQNRAEKVKEVFIANGISEDRLKSVGLPGPLGSSTHDTVMKIVGF